MKRLVLRPDAEAELAAAAAWYDEKRAGLGAELCMVTERALFAIQETPDAYPVWQSDHPYRKYVVGRFPFVIFFTVDDAAVAVVAVAHARRRPGCWAR